MGNIVLIFSSNTLINEEKKLYNISELANNYIIGVISHDNNKLSCIKDIYKDNEVYVECILRSEIRNCIKDHSEYIFIIIGNTCHDMQLAANNKLLYFNALWRNPDEASTRYGIPLDNIKKLTGIIPLLINSSGWYRTIHVDDITTVHSLMNARTRTNEYSNNTKILINGFHDLLKKGDYKYFKVLLYYLLGVIRRDSSFNDIQDWAIFPSSSTTLNPEMNEFKEHVRYMMNGKKSAPIFIRHTTIEKSHRLNYDDRLYCDRHFDSIHLNPKYEGKLKGRVVCVLDDYLTNGTSFETARNLLLSQNVKKIVCISLGSFDNCYYRQDYHIKGNVFSDGYKYKLKEEGILNTDTYNKKAINDIDRIATLILNK